MAQIRAATGSRPLIQWVIDALRLGCYSADLETVRRPRGQVVESLFLELPPDLASRVQEAAEARMMERTAFVRSCFAYALLRTQGGYARRRPV